MKTVSKFVFGSMLIFSILFLTSTCRLESIFFPQGVFEDVIEDELDGMWVFIQEPDDDSVFDTTETIDIGLRAYCESGIESLWLSISNTDTDIGSYQIVFQGATPDLTQIDWNISTNLSPGDYTISSYVNDFDGDNSKPVSCEIRILASDGDSNVYAIIDSPADGSTISAQSFDVFGTAGSAYGNIESVRVQIQPSANSVDESAWQTALGTSNWTNTIIVSEDGNYAIYVQSIDELGYMSFIEAVTVTIDYFGQYNSEISDSETVELAYNDLMIGFSATDNASSVRGDLTLPGTGTNGAIISWSSDDESYISNSGEVTRPVTGQPDVLVTMTANIIKGSESTNKTFNLTVLALSDTNELYLTIDSPTDGQLFWTNDIWIFGTASATDGIWNISYTRRSLADPLSVTNTWYAIGYESPWSNLITGLSNNMSNEIYVRAVNTGFDLTNIQKVTIFVTNVPILSAGNIVGFNHALNDILSIGTDTLNGTINTNSTYIPLTLYLSPDGGASFFDSVSTFGDMGSYWTWTNDLALFSAGFQTVYAYVEMQDGSISWTNNIMLNLQSGGGLPLVNFSTVDGANLIIGHDRLEGRIDLPNITTVYIATNNIEPYQLYSNADVISNGDTFTEFRFPLTNFTPGNVNLYVFGHSGSEWSETNFISVNLMLPNLIPDGEMEDWTNTNNLNAWTELGTGTISKENSEIYEGLYAAKFDTPVNMSADLLSQVLPIQSNANYQISFQAKNTGTIDGKMYLIFLNNNLLITNRVITNNIPNTAGGYQLFETNHVTSPTTVNCVILFHLGEPAGLGTMYIDDVRMNKQ